MTSPDRTTIENVLRHVRTTDGTASVADLGRLDAFMLRDGVLHVAIATERGHAPALQPLLPELERGLVHAVPGCTGASVILTAHRATPSPAPAPTAPAPAGGGHRPLNLGGGAPKPATGPLPPGVGVVIAVASGKGGVGKSTTAVNLAVGLGLEGLKVGLMDADVHGPSLPRMMGMNAQPEVRDSRLIPPHKWGISAMSIGMLVDEGKAMIWRGPMVMGAINQLLGDVDWGALDVLVVDMPPGTGDAQLTLAQKTALAGAVIVSTPQDIALLDARRGIAMFEKMNVPVLGMVENMSYFCCPNCNHRTELFGHGGARAEAEKMGVPFLGEVPLLADIRASADAGAPIVIAAPDSAAGQAYRALAHTVAGALRRLLDKKPKTTNEK
ncbi:ATP-binding protein [Komagataeibacter rhaeticus]|uniref:Iron-sulfur cluster carrier protein n=2 Tax=Komagataeibacter rhaeticus TaxID=215221 RepID=A0A858JS53_9PROT|nr:Mrp/NBP35 family ATP-binding protein [Komagataeibacter rhaeticus]ATU73800.1 MRP family ATP-binding protein [Komagataeibacter xylinus]EGG78363.1 Iron-sulfur protein NUBPL [Gluconacetobacter sp. SXCC-1]KDU94854.1 [Fe-S]-binding protein [Komagataeibacter rhaeticus AF1]MBL7239326.1 Mrp/NBP35 family ATP-binding protein [Komagataeibacter rhaeticus]PYD55111.1 ATP-binding protein [Komagataeibacter rhaeticus]